MAYNNLFYCPYCFRNVTVHNHYTGDEECDICGLSIEEFVPRTEIERKVRMMAEALRAAVVENVRSQGLITDAQAQEILDQPINKK